MNHDMLIFTGIAALIGAYIGCWLFFQVCERRVKVGTVGIGDALRRFGKAICAGLVWSATKLDELVKWATTKERK